MRVLFYWSNISGYMAACWRALAATPGVDLHVVAKRTGGKASNTAFNDDLMRGVSCVLVPADEQTSPAVVREAFASHRPDIVVINGWHTPSLRGIPFLPGAERTKFIMAMDTPYLGTWRQRFGRFRHRAYFSRMDNVFVTGERCWQLARVLGFPEQVIHRGVYGIDLDLLSPIHGRRVQQPGGWPKRFLYTGRYVDEKSIDVLVDGYRRYRARTREPWPLTCCGSGPHASMLKGQEGITDRGFVQPSDLAQVMVEHGVFVLASRFDPWPLVIVESCAAGLPIVCSEACGTRVELVRSCWNGMSFATDDADQLADRLAWMHERHAELPEMGSRSRIMAEPYSAGMWVERWTNVFQDLMRAPRGGQR